MTEMTDEVKSDIEFLVGLGHSRRPELYFVKTEREVREYLRGALAKTLECLTDQEPTSTRYDPGTEYSSLTHLYMPLADDVQGKAAHLFSFDNPKPLSKPTEDLPKVTFYCARFSEADDSRMLAVKQTSQFARRLQRPGRLSFANGGLQMVDRAEFQLADDFDFVIRENDILILRHGPFETALGLQNQIKASVASSVDEFRVQLKGFDFDQIAHVASKNMRCARLVASIKANNYLAGVTTEGLKNQMEKHGKVFTETEGIMSIDPEDSLFVLRVLARQILGIELVEGLDEQFVAVNRSALRRS